MPPPFARLGLAVVVLIAAASAVAGPTADEMARARRWSEEAFARPRPVAEAQEQGEGLVVLRRAHQVLRDRNVWGTPLRLDDRRFAHGLYMDAPASVRVRLGQPAVELTALVGIDRNEDTQRNPGAGSARFHVAVAGRRVASTPVLHLGQGAVPFRADLGGARLFDLETDDGGNGRGWDQCAWAELKVRFQDGSVRSLESLPLRSAPANRSNAPFSFLYGGTASERLLPAWDYSTKAGPIEGGSRAVVSYRDPKTGLLLECEATQWSDSAGVDWVCSLENTGTADTPLVEEFLPLDCAALLEADPAGPPVVLRWSNGDRCAADSFLPHDEPLVPGAPRPFAGQSSDTACLPFFNLKGPDAGWIVAVGWTGRWRAEFERGENGRVRAVAGMAQTRFRLRPGERVRGPRIALLHYHGKEMIRGHNEFRRMLLSHYVPRRGGKPVQPPVALTNVAGLWLRSNRTRQPLGRLTEATEVAAIPKAAGLGCEAYWMDAYWFPQPWWDKNMGNWYPRPEDFPRGLRPLGDAAHRHGMEFVLWFAPLHVSEGSRWAKDHPQYIHGGAKGGGWKLGDPEARRFLTEWLGGRVRDWGVDVYREDFGTPLPPEEGEDRAGLAEMRQVEGFYRFWSDLLAQNPGLAIDNCSGGGRRIDLETASRAYTLWRSDFNDVGEGLKDRPHWPQMGRADQVMVTGLSLYFPLHTGPVWDMRPYNFRSAMTSGVVIYTDVEAPEFSPEQARKAIAELKRLRPLFMGDLYPLLPLTTSQADWYAYQLHRQDLGEGCALVFRRPENADRTRRLRLQEIDPSAEYHVGLTGETYDEAAPKPMKGGDLQHMEVSIDSRPGSALVRYRQVRRP